MFHSKKIRFFQAHSEGAEPEKSWITLLHINNELASHLILFEVIMFCRVEVSPRSTRAPGKNIGFNNFIVFILHYTSVYLRGLQNWWGSVHLQSSNYNIIPNALKQDYLFCIVFFLRNEIRLKVSSFIRLPRKSVLVFYLEKISYKLLYALVNRL